MRVDKAETASHGADRPALLAWAASTLSQPLQHLRFSALSQRQKHQPSKLWLALWTTSYRCPFQDDGMPRRELSVLQAQPESSRKPQQSTKMSKLLSILHWALPGLPHRPKAPRAASGWQGGVPTLYT